MAGFEIVRPLPDRHRRAAASLFWDAFGAKLGRTMGPDDRALAFLEDALHADAIFGAVDGDALLGIAAVYTDGVGVVDAELPELWRHYGWSVLWRALPLALLVRTPPRGVLQMDGISVAAEARGRGVGTALLAAVYAEAATRGLTGVTLDVVDTNPRARALYEREGFVATSTEDLGPFRRLFGFDHATRMLRPVP